MHGQESLYVALAVPRNGDDSPAYHISVMQALAYRRSMEMVTAGSSLTPPATPSIAAAVHARPPYSFVQGLLMVLIRH
jgi:hypothetical protein